MRGHQFLVFFCDWALSECVLNEQSIMWYFFGDLVHQLILEIVCIFVWTSGPVSGLKKWPSHNTYGGFVARTNKIERLCKNLVFADLNNCSMGAIRANHHLLWKLFQRQHMIFLLCLTVIYSHPLYIWSISKSMLDEWKGESTLYCYYIQNT